MKVMQPTKSRKSKMVTWQGAIIIFAVCLVVGWQVYIPIFSRLVLLVSPLAGIIAGISTWRAAHRFRSSRRVALYILSAVAFAIVAVELYYGAMEILLMIALPHCGNTCFSF